MTGMVIIGLGWMVLLAHPFALGGIVNLQMLAVGLAAVITGGFLMVLPPLRTRPPIDVGDSWKDL